VIPQPGISYTPVPDSIHNTPYCFGFLLHFNFEDALCIHLRQDKDMVEERQQALLTDLYELTMAAAYYRHDMFRPAIFSLVIRNYPRTEVILSVPAWSRSSIT
jgi:hypothetical protein